MSEWHTYPLAELTINHDGKRKPVKESERRSGPYPYYGASGIVDYVDDYLIDGDYLLIAEDGENLRTRQTPIAFMARGKSWVNNHAHIVTGNDKADTRFLMYALQSADVSAYLTGAVMPKLTQGNLNRIPISCPLLDEQRTIAHILGTLDDKIELNRRMNETLEAIARAMFKSWFVDFDPVRAKMSGEPPESICQRLGLTPDLLAIFPDRLVDSELGEIPEGWEVHGLDSMATLITKSVAPSAKPDEVFEHYSIPAFDAGATPSYEFGATIKSNKYVVSHNAVLVSKLNPETPRIWLPFVKTANAVCSTEFMQFEPRFDCIRSFLYLLMNAETMQTEILKRVTGSTGSRQRAQPSQIAVLPIVVPTEKVVRAFDFLIRPMLGHAMTNVDQSQTLANLRDSLLPKLLSGELRVNDAVILNEGVSA